MPFCDVVDWLLTNTRSPATTVTPSMVCKPDNVMFVVVAQTTGCFHDRPAAK